MKERQNIASGSPGNVLTLNNIKSAFSIDVEVFSKNPITHTPYVIPSLNGKEQLKVV
ncbi:ABC transporter related protein [Thermoanaerobacter ethanolicus JW 200]|nr:ABC transporter related protein [Thermoanaerobacter ethanolicus JW 200]